MRKLAFVFLGIGIAAVCTVILARHNFLPKANPPYTVGYPIAWSESPLAGKITEKDGVRRFHQLQMHGVNLGSQSIQLQSARFIAGANGWTRDAMVWPMGKARVLAANSKPIEPNEWVTLEARLEDNEELSVRTLKDWLPLTFEVVYAGEVVKIEMSATLMKSSLEQLPRR